MKTVRIARLKITLAKVKPTVFRRVEVPLAIRLDRLHFVIQAAMGWTNSHLYEFRAGSIGWSDPSPDWDHDPPLDAGKASLADAIAEAGPGTIKYLYDFGDGWEHRIKIERIEQAMPGAEYPCLLDAVGRCPPEDVGGPWGYGRFVAAINDPTHKDHAHFHAWYGGDFDPAEVDIADLAVGVGALAGLWSRKRAGKRSN
jgi:hypothetical protein